MAHTHKHHREILSRTTGMGIWEEVEKHYTNHTSYYAYIYT